MKRRDAWKRSAPPCRVRPAQFVALAVGQLGGQPAQRPLLLELWRAVNLAHASIFVLADKRSLGALSDCRLAPRLVPDLAMCQTHGFSQF